MSVSHTPLKILFTQRDLKYRSGSELFTIETALAMRDRGHEVRVYTPGGGNGMVLLRSKGIHVETRLSDLEWQPDIIHGQHHLQAITALLRFPQTPMVYYMHGGIPWVEQPPIHGRILKYVVMCEALIEGMETNYHIPKKKVVAISNFVDLNRFSRVRNVAAKPSRALIFGNYRYSPEQMNEIEAACIETGLSLDKKGWNFGMVSEHPEIDLLQYDIVFAVGRCALEALAVGCAVIPVFPGLACSLVTSENLSRMRYTNFSPRKYSPEAQLDKEWLISQIQRFSSQDTTAVTQFVRNECGMGVAVEALERVYRETIELHQEMKPLTLDDEYSQLHNYLEWIGPEADQLWGIKVGVIRDAEINRETLTRVEKELAETRLALALQMTESSHKLEQIEINKTGLIDRLKENHSSKVAKLEKTIASLRSFKQKWQATETYLNRGPLRRHFLKKIIEKQQSKDKGRTS
jgi:hypothetical protein